MAKRIREIMALSAIGIIAGCAGRPAAPVEVVQLQDQQLGCTDLRAEVDANNKRLSQLGKEEDDKLQRNTLVGAAGFVIPLAWFGLDLHNAAGKEISALQARQQYLGVLAAKRC